MAETIRIKPDIQFVKELQAVGGDTLKKCYQCATCSVACPISPSANPYPRKEMVWASWGLKDKLLSDVDIWLCHNCGSCSELCPRGAKPGDLLGALRNMAYQSLVKPSIIGKWMSAPKYLPILVAIPAILFAVVWAIVVACNFGGNFNGSWIPQGKIVFGKLFYGDYTIDPIFIIVVGFVLFTFYRGIMNLIHSVKPQGKVLMLGKQKHWILHLLDVIFGEVLTHSKFADCGTPKTDRKIGHMTLFYGFAALVVVTAVVFVGHWGGRLIPAILVETPLPQTNPIKILANIGALMLVIGLGLLTIRRRRENPAHSISTYYDWYLLGVIWVVAITGILSQLFRLADLATLAYSVYYIHLVSVFMLFAYLPWSKLGHLVYRTTALTYVRYMGRR